MAKRILAMFLCIVMCVSMVPAQAFAEDGVDESITEETHSHESEAVRVVFNCNPAETIIWVASDIVDEYAPEEDGSFLFQPGHYYYMAYCGGYVGLEEELIIEEGSEDMTIDVVLRTEGEQEETPTPTPAVEPTTVPTTEPTETPDSTVEPTPDLIISQWSWIGADELVDGELALPGASVDNVAFFDDVCALLPYAISTEYGEIAVTWNCDAYPAEGAYEGGYVFLATLPEGYVLADEIAPLCVSVTLGGAALFYSYFNGSPAATDENGNLLINSSNFPHENFRSYISSKFDTAHKGYLTQSQVASITYIDCGGKNIQSLTGIQYFTALTRLDCDNNKLTSLDLSKNSNLTELNCSYNQLSSLNLLDNKELVNLYCNSNKLTSLLIYKTKLNHLDCNNNSLQRLIISGAIMLEYLDCSNNNLTELDVSPLNASSSLKYLNCSDNNLTDLDLSNNWALVEARLDTQYVNVEAQWIDNAYRIDMSKLLSADKVKNVYNIEGASYDEATNMLVVDDSIVEGNQLYQWVSYLYDHKRTKVGGMLVHLIVNFAERPNDKEMFNGSPAEVDENGNLLVNDVNFPDYYFRNYVWGEFGCYGKGYITEEQADNATKISIMDGSIYEDLKSLKGIEYFTSLTELHCVDTQLRELDISNNLALETLSCYYNQLSELDVSKNTALTYLNCWGNYLTTLDVSKNPQLEVLSCGDNKLAVLDVSANTALTYLSCGNNRLSELYVSKNTELTELYCYSNQLTALDVSANTALTYLSCHSNQLSELDVSKNTELTELYCYSNQLTALDVSASTALTSLSCNSNQLSELNVSKNLALTKLECYRNNLTSLDISKNTALTYLSCSTQEATAEAYWENGKCLVDMKKVVGEANISKVAVTSGGDYDSTTGVVTLVTPTEGKGTAELKYEYYHKAVVGTTMPVTLTVSVLCEHNIVSVAAKEPTCTEEGKTEGTRCSECGKICSGMERIPAKGHSYGSWTTIKEANCTEGIQRRDCGNCDHYETRKTDPKHSYGSWTIIKEATGTQSGEERRDCENCDLYETRETYIGMFNGSPAQVDAKGNLLINKANFPDTNFRRDISRYDYDGMGYITSAIAKGVTLYACINEDIASLKGIEYFTSLRTLWCEDNQLTELDMSKNQALEYLSCSDNQLISLNVSKNTALNSLLCSRNLLPKLDLSANTALTYLSCSRQRATADAYMENGKYLVDMKAVVGTSNIANVTVTAGGTYDKLTGIVTLNAPASGAKTAVLVYNYAHGSTLNSTMDVTLTVSLTNNAKLSVPVVTIGNNASSGKPVVSWEEVPGAVAYEVYGKNSKASAYELYTSTESCSFTHSAAEVGETYYYRVRALHSSAASNSAFSTAKAATCDLKMPTISVSNTASSGKPVVSWDAISGAASYDVYARSGNTSTYTKLTNTSSTSYNHSNAVAGETYIYKVRAVHSNAAANSAFSGGKGIVCDLKIPTLSVSTNASSGKPVVSWSAVSGAASYDIYARDSKTSVYTKLTNTSSTSYNHSNAEAGETYIYKVRAVHSNPSANSAFSGGMGVVCDLKMPTISISNNAASGKPTVSWDKISGASSYDIYARSSKTSVYTKLGNTANTSFNHSNAVAGETYFYKVRAVHSKASANSVFTGGKGYICDLAMPTISVSRAADSGKPMVSWDAIDGAAGYEVYVRTSDNAVYTVFATAYGSSFIHSDAEKGEVYFYKVRAIHSNASANSVLSEGKGITSR